MQLSLLPEYETPRRQPLRYFGGKWMLAPWIIQAIARYFPQHEVYVEPFGGGYQVGLRKIPVALEVYNDINILIVNFFQVLRECSNELIPLIESSDRSREGYENCRQLHINPLEQARRTYIEAQLSYCGAGTRWLSGTTDERLKKKPDDSMLWATAKRLQNVLIQQLDAIQCIRLWDESQTVFYVDPPYLQSVRKTKDKRHINGAPRRQYAYELTEVEHIKLGEFLRTVKGGVIISGYDSPLYDSLFDGWIKLSKPAKGNAGVDTECLWINR